MKISYSDSKSGDLGIYRGTFQNDIFHIWRRHKDDISKKEWLITITLNELENVCKKWANKNYCLYYLCSQKEFEQVEKWIENSETEELKMKRRKHWEDYPRIDFQVDSMMRVVKNLYEKAFNRQI